MNTINKEFIIKEFSEFEEYNNLELINLSEDELIKMFNIHCEKYSEDIKAVDIYNKLDNSGILIDSPDGYQLLGDLYKKSPRNIHTVKTNLGKIKVSCDHLLETWEGWKKVSTIPPKSLVLSKHGYIEILSNKITSIEEVYDWEVLHENHRYYCDGISSHNTGKTIVMLNAAKNAQKMGYKIYWYDSENAVDKKLMEEFGIDVSNVWYEPCPTVEAFRHSITNLTNNLIEAQRNGMEIPKVMIFLDSIGNLGTIKENADAQSGSMKEDMTRAKRIKSLFRILMLNMAEVKIPFLYSNHTYKTTDFMAQWKGSGGCLTPGHEVLVNYKNNEFKHIEDLVKGELVETLSGKKEIIETFTFDKNVLEIEFEDGSIITCSEDHRFYLGGDIHNDDSWIRAKDLKSTNTILKVG